MSTTVNERMAQMSRETERLKKRLVTQQAALFGLAGLIVTALCMGAVSRDGESGDGDFDRVFANSIIIRNAKGNTAAQLYAGDGGGSLLIRDSSGQEAIHIISGADRNDVLIQDRQNGRIAVALQGMADRGRLSLHRTFANMDAAAEALDERPKEYFGGTEEGEVTVPVQRLPNTSR